jgi:hypothetical protein
MKPKQLAEELGLTAMQIGRTRKQLFPDYEKGTDLSEEEIEAIKEGLGVETFGPKFTEGTVTYARNGSRQVEVSMMGKNGEIIRAPAFIPLAVNAEGLFLQRIPLEYIDYEGTRYYRHAALSEKTWGAVSQLFSNI